MDNSKKKKKSHAQCTHQRVAGHQHHAVPRGGGTRPGSRHRQGGRQQRQQQQRGPGPGPCPGPGPAARHGGGGTGRDGAVGPGREDYNSQRAPGPPPLTGAMGPGGTRPRRGVTAGTAPARWRPRRGAEGVRGGKMAAGGAEAGSGPGCLREGRAGPSRAGRGPGGGRGSAPG